VTTVVWLKRDLRASDHAPLAAAADGASPALALFVFEPAWLRSPECDPQHVAFTLAALADLRAELAARGLPLLVRAGTVRGTLEALHQRLHLTRLFSHEETGPGWTFARDLAVGDWCRAQGVAWTEFPQHGVVRRLGSRSGWATRWQQRMDAAPVSMPAGWPAADLNALDDIDRWPTLAELAALALQPPDARDVLPLRTPRGAPVQVNDALGRADAGAGWREAGWVLDPSTGTARCTVGGPGHRPIPEADAQAAWANLIEFLDTRGLDYRRALSSPARAATGCSRASPWLSLGQLSLREVHQATEARIALAAALAADPGSEPALAATERRRAAALRSFSGRLRWHCHFMQKLEDEPAIEFRPFARVFDGLRDETPDPVRFAAWREGRTGYPMVDACLRQLRATGWLNFRMRAMLVSFAAYHLWLHWRAPGLFLARQFLDFEAGIHWSQMQMQSGTTGINTLRVYSPTKQALDQDPDGDYIATWVPELARVPAVWRAMPWTLPADLQREAGCVIGRDYPAPLVDEATAAREAKERLYPLRATTAAREEADAVQRKHGSRKAGLPATGMRPRRSKRQADGPEPLPQPDLFDALEAP
jgi:deoxyribodipyrimidine photo-lyase